MVDQKNKSAKNSGDWTFDVKVPTPESDAPDAGIPEIPVDAVKEAKNVKPFLQRAKENQEKKRHQNFEFEVDSPPKETLTRRQLAEKLNEEERVRDVFHYAHPIKRALAMFLDMLAYLASVYFTKFFLFPLYSLVVSFTDKYKLDFSVTEETFLEYGFWFLVVFNYFLLFAVGTAFYNRTIGKKFLGIFVREEERFSLSITNMITREMIFKPLSILSVVGVSMMFFNNKKQSLHDRLAKTLVIED